MKILITKTFFFSLGCFLLNTTSRVKVELEVRTRLERVDIDADKTSMITIAIIKSGSSASMVGTTLSNCLNVSGESVILSV